MKASEFLFADPSRYPHEWWQGQHGDFYWIQSKRFICVDFFKSLAPPDHPFHVLAVLNSNYCACCAPDWTPLTSDIIRSPMLSDWRNLPIYVDGGNTVIFPPAVDENALLERLRAMELLNIFEHSDHRLDQPASEAMKIFWHSMTLLQPLFFVDDNNLFTLISPKREIIQNFVDSWLMTE